MNCKMIEMICGKPEDESKALAYWRYLFGKEHEDFIPKIEFTKEDIVKTLNDLISLSDKIEKLTDKVL